MKIIGNTASIKKDTNKLISTTFSDWSAIRDGAFIKFENDSNFYTASRTEQRTYIKDFDVVSAHVIKAMRIAARISVKKTLLALVSKNKN